MRVQLPEVKNMEKEVARIFEILGYKVSSPILDGTPQENFLLERLFEPERFLVECLSGGDEILNAEKLRFFNTQVSKAREEHIADYGIVITGSDFSLPEQQRESDIDTFIKFTGIEELRSKLFDAQSYLRTSLPAWQDKNRIFVDGYGNDMISGAELDKIQDYLYDRAYNSCASLTVLLGGIGSGKSTQLRQIAIKLCQEYLERGAGLIPLYIPLERFRPHRKGAHLDVFIVNHLNHLFYSHGTLYNWAGLGHRLSLGQIILLLDGFDEIGDLNTVEQITRELKHIVDSVGATSKCVLTCRSNFLESPPDIQKVFFTQLKEQYPTLDINIIRLKLFGKREIREYLNKKEIFPPINVINEIVRIELCERPLLLNLLTDTLTVGGELTLPKTEEQLVEHAVTFILDYCSSFFEAEISLADWRGFLEQSAFEMYRIGKRFLEPDDLKELIENVFRKKLNPSALIAARVDARVRTLYELNDEGLTFAHLEFRDFLAAFAIAKSLLRPRPSDVRWACPIGRDVLRFIPFAISKSKNIEHFQYPEIDSSKAFLNVRHMQWRAIPSGLSIVSATGEGPTKDRLAYFPQGFWISANPVTVKDFQIAAKAFPENDFFPTKDFSTLHPDSPLTNVTYEQAQTLCRELFNGRLPTEEEWERAARWVDGSYPREEQISRLHRFQEVPPSVDRDVSPNPWGLKNTSGCVWQWTSTLDPHSMRYICKGSWWGASIDRQLDGSTRLIPTEDAHIRTGFRVVIDNDRSRFS